MHLTNIVHQHRRSRRLPNLKPPSGYKRSNQDIINLTDMEERPSPFKRQRLTLVEDDDMTWLKAEIGSVRVDVSRMRHEINHLKKSIGELLLMSAEH